MGCNYWSLWALEPAPWNKRSLQGEACELLVSRPCQPQLEESLCSHEDPAEPKTNYLTSKKKIRAPNSSFMTQVHYIPLGISHSQISQQFKVRIRIRRPGRGGIFWACSENLADHWCLRIESLSRQIQSHPPRVCASCTLSSYVLAPICYTDYFHSIDTVSLVVSVSPKPGSFISLWKFKSHPNRDYISWIHYFLK